MSSKVHTPLDLTGDHIMDPADRLLDKIYSLVDLEARAADELNEIAAELEKQRKSVNISQVAGSAVSTVGSAALLAAGLCTGGVAIPVLAVGGKVVSMLGLGVSVGSEVVDGINPKLDKKEKEIYEQIENLLKEIQTLTESLADEGKESGVPESDQEEYVTERILRAMVKRYGLMLDTKVSLIKLVFKSSEMGSTLGSCALRLACSLECFLIYKLVCSILKERAGSKAISKAVKSSVASAASRQAVKVAGSKASGKALKYITRGALGFVFSGAELIYNCATLNNCETDKSKSLRERAKEMKTCAENTKKDLNEMKCMLAEVEKKTLLEFANKHCKDDSVKAWLEENEKSEAFHKLVDMFKFLKVKINKEKEKIDRKKIDIIFVAHGSIENPLILASCLLPLSTIQDVVLYSPWNCFLTADAAYGIATGRLEPQHRVFDCGDEKRCKVKQEGHQPTKLPGDWNSMKDAGERGEKIPTISVSPLRPEDGAWERIEFLQDENGRPGKNRILIPFILPGVSDDFEVPFHVVTLALSLVLYFSGYTATIHLAACLGRSVPTSQLSKHHLNLWYSYTIDQTGMTSSEKMLVKTPLSRRFEDLFGWTSSWLSSKNFS